LFQETFDCRQLYCPAGYTYDLDGTCTFLGKQWWVKSLRVRFTIEDINVKLEDAEVLLQSLIANTSFPEDIQPPWKTDWNINEYKYVLKETSKGVMLEELRFDMFFKDFNNYFDIENFLKEVKANILRQWVIPTQTQSIVVTPRLVKFSGFECMKEQHNTTRVGYNVTERVYVPGWQYGLGEPFTYYLSPQEKSQNDGQRDVLHITALFFCQQIQYFKQELEQERPSLIYVVKNDTLSFFPDQYKYYSHNEVSTVRVCAEDAGYVAVSDSSNGLITNGVMSLVTLLVVQCILEFVV